MNATLVRLLRALGVLVLATGAAVAIWANVTDRFVQETVNEAKPCFALLGYRCFTLDSCFFLPPVVRPSQCTS